MHKLAFTSIWLLVLIIPLENALIIPGVGTIGKFVGIVALVIGVTATLMMRMNIRFHHIHFLMFLFVLLTSLSFFWSIDPDETLKRIWTYFQIFVMMWLIFQWADDENKSMRLLQAFGIGTFLLAIGILKTGSVQGGGRIEAYNFNPNDISSILALGIPICWYVYLRNKDKLWGKLFLVAPIVSLLAILLTGSRAGFIKAVIALIFIIWSLPGFSPFKRKAIAAGIGLAIILSLNFIPPETMARLGTTVSEIQSGNLGGRVGIWSIGIGEFLENPVLGIGAGGFSSAVIPFFNVGRAPHNVFLAILVEQGIIGIFAFLAIVYVAASGSIRLRGIEGKLWFVLLTIWAASALTSNWEWRKQTWLLLILAVTHAVALGMKKSHEVAR